MSGNLGDVYVDPVKDMAGYLSPTLFPPLTVSCRCFPAFSSSTLASFLEEGKESQTSIPPSFLKTPVAWGFPCPGLC